jgi:hypothetical protein
VVGQRKLNACRCFTHASPQPLRHRTYIQPGSLLCTVRLQTLFCSFLPYNQLFDRASTRSFAILSIVSA